MIIARLHPRTKHFTIYVCELKKKKKHERKIIINRERREREREKEREDELLIVMFIPRCTNFLIEIIKEMKYEYTENGEGNLIKRDGGS